MLRWKDLKTGGFREWERSQVIQMKCQRCDCTSFESQTFLSSRCKRCIHKKEEHERGFLKNKQHTHTHTRSLPRTKKKERTVVLHKRPPRDAGLTFRSVIPPLPKGGSFPCSVPGLRRSLPHYTPSTTKQLPKGCQW